MTDKRRPGRPFDNGEGYKEYHLLSLRLSTEEYQALKEMADKEGLSMAALVKKKVLGK